MSAPFGIMHVAQGSLGMVATSLVGFVPSAAFLLNFTLLVPFLAHYTIHVLQLHEGRRNKKWLTNY